MEEYHGSLDTLSDKSVEDDMHISFDPLLYNHNVDVWKS